MAAVTPVLVHDPDDPRLADYRHLRHPDRRQRIEGAAGLLVAEGPQVVRQLLWSRYPVRSVVVLPERLPALRAALEDAPGPVAVYLVSRPVLAGVTGFDVHRGALAVADRLPTPGPASLWTGAQRLLVLEDVSDHENLGSLFRSAAALGTDAVLLSPRCADPLYRRAVRVSMGAVLHLPFARISRWPHALRDLRDAGVAVVALTPDGDQTLDHLAASPPERIALLLGNEGTGLSPGARRSADRCVRIPMTGSADSLNVAVAGAVASYVLRPPSPG